MGLKYVKFLFEHLKNLIKSKTENKKHSYNTQVRYQI